MERKLFFACAVACTLAPLAAQPNLFASSVVASDDQGQAGGGIFDPLNALGAPDAAIAFNMIHSLGNGGSLTLGFDVTIVDGPGADLLIAENPFQSTQVPGQTFAEVCFVEVSSNGIDFARVPTGFVGPQVDLGPFDFGRFQSYQGGFVGLIAVQPSPSDPTDILAAGGDAIDLATLHNHPLVTAGTVDLGAIAQVRLVDAQSGIDVDSAGTLVRDPVGGSADIDGVTVLQWAANQSPDAPTVAVTIPVDGRFELTFTDPNGLADFDGGSIGVAAWGFDLPLDLIFAASSVVSASPTSVTLKSNAVLPPEIGLQLSVTARDLAGRRSSAATVRAVN